jgi:heat shock protein HslJ
MRKTNSMSGIATLTLATAAIVMASLLAADAKSAVATATELANATYRGIEDHPVRLQNKLWQGEPFVAGGASRPRVGLVDDFRLTGDVNNDGVDEAVVVLWQSSGGSGTYLFLAVMGRADSAIDNIATAPIGDRVQIRSGRIDDGKIELDLVQQGSGDAACCPSRIVIRSWTIGVQGLSESPIRVTGTLTPADIGRRQWILSRFARGEAAPESPEITLTYKQGQFVGHSGCNRYFGQVTAGQMPGDLVVGPIAGTRMACPAEVMDVEQRFLTALESAFKFSYLAGKLALNWREGDTFNSLLFIPGDVSSQ